MLKYGESRGIKVNKSHAAAYATISYMTAWLKYHYPAEYMCSVMTRAGSAKLPALVNECKKMGLKIMPPDINASMDGFTNREETILYGFGNIKNVASAGAAIEAERSANGAFTSVKDFTKRMMTRGNYSKDVMMNLVKAGAFDQFCDGNRASILATIEVFGDITKKMLDKSKELATRQSKLEEMITSGASEAEVAKMKRAVQNSQKAYDNAYVAFVGHSFALGPEDHLKKLDEEHELLGAYLSGSPFDVYSDAVKKVRGRVELADVANMTDRKKITVCGMVKDLKMLQRKSDGRPFCIFTLVDETGEVETKCFTEKFSKYGDAIFEGRAFTITGWAGVERNTSAEGDDVFTEVTMSVETMALLKRNSTEVAILHGDSIVSYQENYDAIKKFASPCGIQAKWSDTVDVVTRPIDFLVSPDIKDAEIPGVTVEILHTT